MKPITIYTANCRENPLNNRYPHKHVITSADDLKDAACFDQVFAQYRDSHRAKADFITSDCLPFDCDNDHSENPEEWDNTETYLFYLERQQKFEMLSSSVRSQMRRAVKLYAAYKSADLK